MMPYTAKIFFIDGSNLAVDCDDFLVSEVGCYIATRDGLEIITIPFNSVKYTVLIEN